MMRMLLVSLAAVGLAAAIGSAPAAQGRANAAQRPAAAMPQRHWFSVNVVTVKREMAGQWREFQRTQAMPLQQRGGVGQRDTWQGGAPFGEGLTYAIVTPIENFAEYDKPPLVSRMLTGDALTAYQQKNGAGRR